MPSARSWVVHSHPVVVEQQPGGGGGTRARVLDLHSGAFLTDDRYLFTVAAGDTRFP